MLPRRGEARSQIRLTERLLHRLRHDRLIDMPIVACAYFDVESAVAQARRRLAGMSDSEPEWPIEPPALRIIHGE
jgi:hypothetical protein